MKYILSILLIATFGFANQTYQNLSPPIQAIFKEKEEVKNYTYFKFSGGENNVLQPQQPSPGLGIGFRYKTAASAFDICVSGVGLNESRSRNYQFLLPRIGYISYINPTDEKTYYYSYGLAWGFIENSKQKFTGIVAHASLGYEFFKSAEFLGFSEATIYQPALSIKEISQYPSPTFEMSVGMGF